MPHTNNIIRVYAVKCDVWYYMYHTPTEKDRLGYYDVPHTPLVERSGAIKALHQIIKWRLKMIDAKAVVSGK